jgi:hypothetical protein
MSTHALHHFQITRISAIGRNEYGVAFPSLGLLDGTPTLAAA